MEKYINKLIKGVLCGGMEAQLVEYWTRHDSEKNAIKESKCIQRFL